MAQVTDVGEELVEGEEMVLEPGGPGLWLGRWVWGEPAGDTEDWRAVAVL